MESFGHWQISPKDRKTESPEERIFAEGGCLGENFSGLSDFLSPGLSFNSKIP